MLRRFVSLLTVLMILLSFTAALAEATPMPSPVPLEPGIQAPLYGSHSDYLKIKDELYRKGYYTTQVDLNSRFLDDQTLLAVRKVCEKTGLPYSDKGICQETYNKLLSGDFPNFIEAATVTPTPTVAAADLYPHISYGDENGYVTELQKRLQKLNYGGNMTIGKYDEAMMDAIDVCLEVNGMSGKSVYDQHENNGISSALHEYLLTTEELLPFSTPAPEVTEEVVVEPGFLEKTIAIGSLELKMPVFLGICIGIVVIIAVVCILLFGSKKKDTDTPVIADGDAVAVVGKGKILFEIEYKGKVTHYRTDIKDGDALKIGRNVGNFPLDVSDSSISRKHCEIYYDNKSLMLRDYSSYGTTVNGKDASRGAYKLSSGDLLKIGAHNVTIKF